LSILRNNLTKKFKLGGSSKLYSAKGLEDTAICKAYSQKEEIGKKKIYPIRLSHSQFLNMVLHDGIHTEKDR